MYYMVFCYYMTNCSHKSILEYWYTLKGDNSVILYLSEMGFILLEKNILPEGVLRPSQHF